MSSEAAPTGSIFQAYSELNKQGKLFYKKTCKEAFVKNSIDERHRAVNPELLMILEFDGKKKTPTNESKNPQDVQIHADFNRMLKEVNKGTLKKKQFRIPVVKEFLKAIGAKYRFLFYFAFT